MIALFPSSCFPAAIAVLAASLRGQTVSAAQNQRVPSKPPYTMHAVNYGNSSAGMTTQLIVQNPPLEPIIVVAFSVVRTIRLSLHQLWLKTSLYNSGTLSGSTGLGKK